MSRNYRNIFRTISKGVLDICKNLSEKSRISEDGKMYVQVSTGQDIPTKVKSTLEKIRDSKSDELKSIEQLFFFVLANSSESKVMDFSGKERIGRINFIKSKNLITTENIVQKAKTDIEFPIKLYDFLLTESESVVQISNKLNEAITISKVLINNNIDCLINDEYIIDRSSEISQIRKDGFNFISIQGEAGSGKSALCKLLLEKEKMVLYTRAEKIAEVSSLEDIWGLDIGKTIEYLKKKKLYIYIDALEFIVDCSKTKMDLLQQIYEIVKGHNNIFIITSCRTSDRTAFVKIENIYQIKRYDIFLLSDKQIIKVAQKYKIVQKLWDGLCDKDSSAIVDMLFDLPDFGQMSSDGYELYEEIAAHLLAVYFDAYKNIEIRRKCEVTLLAIEDKISHICELEVRNNLCKMMFLTLGKIHMHDWNELHTEYSYKDKMFLNEIWSKYGWLHFKNLLYVINQMHITELLPEIILPLNESLRKCGENYADCKEMIKANAVIINKIITKAFLDFNDDIKCDHELVKAFEEVLETLVGFGMEEAAVILDEFRVH